MTDILQTNVYVTPVYITVSGLCQDEVLVLEGYRAVKERQGGTLFLDMQNGVVQKFDVKPNCGNAQLLNTALGKRKLRE